ncbi:MAG: hypothetical protein GOVbin4162_74 [Prokaryotic dsDNA virus sp.]|nr:MAG: hypothetical protein GOVbin4162_74 [Prokaryotic dsDNA virus sp.]|tara:strand:- start:1070 stop:1345 length:276 start_codon:yes stop_codon:yes gene_type:complete
MNIQGYILNDEGFRGNIKEWKDAQTQIDALKDLQSNIADVAKQKFNITAGDFNKIAKACYDEQSTKRKYEEAETLVHAREILENKKEQEQE